ncbi:MAG: molybdenum ABC transporter ATP-binding protein [Proteobacteria bacterium]|nr:molybdenum ABC transporter ATP-binding protein [Pseudomonadota bacterium]
MMLEVDVRHRRGPFALEARFAAPTPGVIALFGRSGSGKTTLVNLISGLLQADAGRVSLDGEVLADRARGIDVPVESRRIGYVFQEARLFPHLSVEGNLRYGQRRARGAQVIGFGEVVELLGLAGGLARRPHQLSGGERQRVALGRALLAQPRLLLLDEPLAALDLARRREVLPYLDALRERLRIPIVYVSHQFEEVLRLATHLVLLDGGRVLAQGTVSELSLRPELQAIVGAEFTGAVLEADVAGTDAEGNARLELGAGTIVVRLPGARPGTRVRLQVLARDVILALQAVEGLSVRNALPGTVRALSTDAEGVLVEVELGGAAVLARITVAAQRALGLAPGLPVWALFKAVSTGGHAFALGRGP